MRWLLPSAYEYSRMQRQAEQHGQRGVQGLRKVSRVHGALLREHHWYRTQQGPDVP